MSSPSTPLVKAILTGLHTIGADRVYERATNAHGIIFMLHRVLPGVQTGFAPNRILSISPDFLEVVITEARAAGLELVSLDEVARRLSINEPAGRFACFTFDDGYRDNFEHAYPILKRHNVPFTIYIAPKLADGEGDFWWFALEEAIACAKGISVDLGDGCHHYATETEAEKWACFNEVYWSLRAMPECRARRLVREICEDVGYDPGILSRELPMNWEQLRDLNRDPLVTLGAHTTNHVALAKLPYQDALTEMRESVARLSAELGEPCRHFSYPYGDEGSAGVREFEMAAQLGLETAVTTQKGLVPLKGPRPNLYALKRLSLNGDFQRRDYLRALMSGLPFRLLSGARQISGNLTAAREPVQTGRWPFPRSRITAKPTRC